MHTEHQWISAITKFGDYCFCDKNNDIIIFSYFKAHPRAAIIVNIN